jgi:integrin beta 8
LVGATGAAGADGEDGAPGAAGLDGDDGADGKTILYGAVAPTTEGVDGDFYIDTVTHTLYGPKATTWPAGTSLVGPAGADGADGTNGTNGTDGTTAYEAAFAGGYTDTEANFNTLFAGLGDISAALDLIVGGLS